MMKPESEHLEYLMSQYLDGSLDAESRKAIEQELAKNPAAQELLREQHEVQDLLDDWGSRIPMVDWAKFDAQLTARLDAEETAAARRRRWGRWLRPAAVAASLLMAAAVGYSWHAWTQPVTVAQSGGQGPAAVTPQVVQVVDRPAASPVVPVLNVDIVDAPRKAARPTVHVAISEPIGSGSGARSGGVAVEPASAMLPQTQPGTVTAGTQRPESDRDTLH